MDRALAGETCAEASSDTAPKLMSKQATHAPRHFDCSTFFDILSSSRELLTI
jgi:hypothetical protein